MLNLGRWSTHTESLFPLVDQTFSDQTQNQFLKRQPLTRGAWGDRARSSLDIKNVRRRLEAAASKLFN
jgi:hypothetical protein